MYIENPILGFSYYNILDKNLSYISHLGNDNATSNHFSLSVLKCNLDFRLKNSSMNIFLINSLLWYFFSAPFHFWISFWIYCELFTVYLQFQYSHVKMVQFCFFEYELFWLSYDLNSCLNWFETSFIFPLVSKKIEKWLLALFSISLLIFTKKMGFIAFSNIFLQILGYTAVMVIYTKSMHWSTQWWRTLCMGLCFSFFLIFFFVLHTVMKLFPRF